MRRIKLVSGLILAGVVSIGWVAADEPSNTKPSAPAPSGKAGAARSKRSLSQIKLPLPAPNAPVKRVLHSEREWERLLTRNQFASMRMKLTEAAFTGVYWNNHEPGVYFCAACELPLFTSTAKFDSGTGWPSFFGTIADKRIKREIDLSEGEPRIEVMCAGCDGHLGHVFQDGPAPTGLRFCINSVALRFVSEYELQKLADEAAEAKQKEKESAVAKEAEKTVAPGGRRVDFK